MIEIRDRVAPGGEAHAHARLELPFDLRRRTRQRARLASGEEVALLLPRGSVLRGGELLRASDGRTVEVVASSESVLHVVCDTPQALARAAYHLGNRHVPVEVGEGYLRIAADHVLEQMLQGLGARVATLEAPFEPESGAYAGHTHLHMLNPGEARQVGRIHEYGKNDDVS